MFASCSAPSQKPAIPRRGRIRSTIEVRPPSIGVDGDPAAGPELERAGEVVGDGGPAEARRRPGEAGRLRDRGRTPSPPRSRPRAPASAAPSARAVRSRSRPRRSWRRRARRRHRGAAACAAPASRICCSFGPRAETSSSIGPRCVCATWRIDALIVSPTTIEPVMIAAPRSEPSTTSAASRGRRSAFLSASRLSTGRRSRIARNGSESSATRLSAATVTGRPPPSGTGPEPARPTARRRRAHRRGR